MLSAIRARRVWLYTVATGVFLTPFASAASDPGQASLSSADIRQLTADLKSPNEDARERAFSTLSFQKDLPPPTLFAVRELVRRLTAMGKPANLGDLSWPHRSVLSIYVNDSAWEPGFLESLARTALNHPDWTVEQFDEGDPEITLALLRALKVQPVPDSVLPGIIAACGNSSETNRTLAFDMLTPDAGKFPELLPITTKALSDDDFVVAQKAFGVFRKYYLQPKNLPALLKVRTSQGNFWAGLELIGLIGCKNTIPGLTDALLHDPDVADRRLAAAAISLRCFGPPEPLQQRAVSGLFHALHDPDDRVRGNALRSLGFFAQQSPATASRIADALRKHGLALQPGRAPGLGESVYQTVNVLDARRVSEMVQALQDLR